MIFQIKSNIRHNGNDLKIGDFIEAELVEFEQLVKDGVMRLFESGVSMDEAKAIVEGENQGTENSTATPAPAPESQNTWGPKQADPEVPAAPADEASSTATNDIKAPEAPLGDVVPGETTEPKITGEEL